MSKQISKLATGRVPGGKFMSLDTAVSVIKDWQAGQQASYGAIKKLADAFYDGHLTAKVLTEAVNDRFGVAEDAKQELKDEQRRLAFNLKSALNMSCKRRYEVEVTAAMVGKGTSLDDAKEWIKAHPLTLRTLKAEDILALESDTKALGDGAIIGDKVAGMLAFVKPGAAGNPAKKAGKVTQTAGGQATAVQKLGDVSLDSVSKAAESMPAEAANQCLAMIGGILQTDEAESFLVRLMKSLQDSGVSVAAVLADIAAKAGKTTRKPMKFAPEGIAT